MGSKDPAKFPPDLLQNFLVKNTITDELLQECMESVSHATLHPLYLATSSF